MKVGPFMHASIHNKNKTQNMWTDGWGISSRLEPAPEFFRLLFEVSTDPDSTKNSLYGVHRKFFLAIRPNLFPEKN
jgi:hypothetical protein